MEDIVIDSIIDLYEAVRRKRFWQASLNSLSQFVSSNCLGSIRFTMFGSKSHEIFELRDSCESDPTKEADQCIKILADQCIKILMDYYIEKLAKADAEVKELHKKLVDAGYQE